MILLINDAPGGFIYKLVIGYQLYEKKNRLRLIVMCKISYKKGLGLEIGRETRSLM